MLNVRILTLSSLIMAAALAGCSSSSYDKGPHANSTTSTQSMPANAEYMPNYMASTSLGQVMTTPQGSTVYTFDKDQTGKSNCYGECARNWPPVLAPAVRSPMDGCLAARHDGQEQWAYDGKPLYNYAEDSMHGDGKGENAGKPGRGEVGLGRHCTVRFSVQSRFVDRAEAEARAGNSGAAPDFSAATEPSDRAKIHLGKFPMTGYARHPDDGIEVDPVPVSGFTLVVLFI